MTFPPTPRAPHGSAGPAGRAARAGAVTLLAVPAMLLAHLVTARTVPEPGVVALVALAVFAVTAATGTVTRWRLAAVVGLAQVAGHALLAVLHPVTSAPDAGGCLPLVGRGAALGLRLALLRQDSTCPRGTLATGPTTTAALAGLLAAALVLVGHGLVAVLAAALVVGAHLAVETLRACAVLVRPRPVPAAVPADAPRSLTAAPVAVRPAHEQWTAHPPQRRGPPVAVVPR